MKIIQITNKKTYTLLTSESGKSILVSPDYVQRASLYIGSELDSNSCFDDNKEFLRQFAMDSALNYISYCDRTEEQIRQHLKRKKLPEIIILPVIEKLKEYRYADDARYASLYIESAKLSSKGKKLTASKLKQKGIDTGILDQALELYSEEDERDGAEEFVKKQNRILHLHPPAIRKEKILRQAVLRGYSPSLIYDILQAYVDDNHDYCEYYAKLIDKKALAYYQKGIGQQEATTKLIAYFLPKGATKDLIYERVLNVFKNQQFEL